MSVVFVPDLVDRDDPAGRTYRQINLAKTHAIPVGTLVEILDDDEGNEPMAGVRLFVVNHGRDCDGTPLYYMSPEPDDTVEQRPGFMNPKWIGGWSDDGLRIIKKGSA